MGQLGRVINMCVHFHGRWVRMLALLDGGKSAFPNTQSLPFVCGVGVIVD